MFGKLLTLCQSFPCASFNQFIEFSTTSIKVSEIISCHENVSGKLKKCPFHSISSPFHLLQQLATVLDSQVIECCLMPSTTKFHILFELSLFLPPLLSTVFARTLSQLNSVRLLLNLITVFLSRFIS